MTTPSYIPYNPQAYAEQYQTHQQNAVEDKIWLKFEEGETLIRIVPAPLAWLPWFKARGSAASPFVGYFKHQYERPDKPGQHVSYACPRRNRTPGQPRRECPDCERGFALLANAADESEERYAKSFMTKYRMLVNVVVRGQDVLSPLVWDMSAPIPGKESKKGRIPLYEQLHRFLVPGRKQRDLINPGPEGYDVIVTRKGKGRDDTNYMIEVADDPCPLSDDPEEIERLVNACHDLTAITAPPSPEIHAAILSGKGRVRQISSGGAGDHRALAEPAEESETVQDFIDTTVGGGDEFRF